MAKYDVTHSCGHEVTHHLTGKHKIREWRISKLESELCESCRLEKWNADNDAANAAAAEKAESAGLIELVGSEKQIAWAESIRVPAIEKYKAFETKTESLASYLSDAAKQELRDAILLIVDEAVNQTSASWWIENRNESVVSSPGMYVKWAIENRELAPTAAAEKEAESTRRKEAAEKKHKAIVKIYQDTDWLAGEIEWDSNYNPKSVTVGDNVLTIYCGRTSVNGLEVNNESVNDQLRGLGIQLRQERRAAEKAERHGSLTGLTVVSIEVTRKRSEPNWIITLSDGQVALGYVRKSKKEYWIEALAASIDATDKVVDQDHPNVDRLADLAWEATK